MKYYRKLNEDGTYTYYDGNSIRTDNAIIMNPNAATLEKNGYTEYEPEPYVQEQPLPGEYINSLVSWAHGHIDLTEISDEEAEKCMAIFPTFSSRMGSMIEVGERIWYNGSLYKAVQAHEVSNEWTPDKAYSLWANISEILHSQNGTIENPIAWESGMTTYKGKYYTEDGVIYLCVRDSGNPLFNTIADVVGIYFETVPDDNA